MKYVYSFIVLALFIAGGDLLYHLGRGSIPDLLKPVANACVNSGIDLKLFNIALWVLFVLIAGALLLFITFPILDTR